MSAGVQDSNALLMDFAWMGIMLLVTRRGSTLLVAGCPVLGVILRGRWCDKFDGACLS